MNKIVVVWLVFLMLMGGMIGVVSEGVSITNTNNAKDTELVACWHFDENTGTTVYDSSGNNNNGTIYGATWTTGVSGSASSFDGGDVADTTSISGGTGKSITVTISLTAQVETVDDPDNILVGAINVGDIITGIYTYDSTTADSNTLPTVGDYCYSSPPYGITVNAGGFVFETDPSNVDFLVEIVNDHGDPPRDNYLLRSYNNLPLSNGALVDHISWQLDDPTATALSSDALPTVPPILTDWESYFGLTLTGNKPVGDLFEFGYFIRAHVTSAYLTHDPIYINGNSDFASQAENESWAGDGTEGNPYIIENWDIDASTAHGIFIENTDVYFIIRNCVIHDGKGNDRHGIYFYSVDNGKIDNVTSYNNDYGIYLYSSSNNNITNNQIYNNDYGIYIKDSSNNNISANYLHNNSYVIYLYHSSNNQLTTNQIYNNYHGIMLGYSSNNNQIIDCAVYNNSERGIYLDGIFGACNYNNITDCAVYNNNDYGIYLCYSSNNNLINCAVYNNSNMGIYVRSSYNTISNCNVYNNSGVGISLYSASNNQITNCNVYNNSYDGIYLKSSSDNEIHYNNIYGNTNYGIYNYNSESTYRVNATYNWWGVADGPSGVGPGSGDAVSSNVLYDPWLIEPHVNLPPVAYIDSISPNPAVAGDTITFTGHGYDTDGYVVAYSWSSDMDGFLSDQTSFSTSTLSVGEHTIYFKVQDNDGTWSTEVNETLVINSTPLSLTVTMNANPTTLNSGETSTITVTVTDGTNPVSGATVNLASNNGGSFTSVIDNDNGTYTATFTAPTVTTQTICRITAEVTKTGYDSGSGYVDVTVNPVIQPTLTVTVSANPTTVSSDETSTITITVTDGTNPIAGTIVSLQSDNGGSFSSVTDNGNGTYTATFTAPTVSSQTVCVVTTNATKTGYISGSNYVNVTVNPVGVENHAPVISGVPEQFGVEDIAWILDVTPYIDDIDNITEDLMITVNSSYVTVDGKILTFLYPNGIITDSVKITVSDGIANANQTITVTITPVNDAPVINSFSPIDNPSIDEGEQQTFAVTASDVDNADLTIQWYLDDNLVATGGGSGIAISCTYTYVADYTSAGTYTVKVVVSAGSLTDEKTWSLTVNDVAGAGAEPEKKGKGFIPSFETATLLVAIIGVYAILLRRRKDL